MLIQGAASTEKLPYAGLLAFAMTGFIAILTETLARRAATVNRRRAEPQRGAGQATGDPVCPELDCRSDSAERRDPWLPSTVIRRSRLL
jgi:hypothetical protein